VKPDDVRLRLDGRVYLAHRSDLSPSRSATSELLAPPVRFHTRHRKRGGRAGWSGADQAGLLQVAQVWLTRVCISFSLRHGVPLSRTAIRSRTG